jgi:YidC/Oxa1 family membrane protein insertase
MDRKGIIGISLVVAALLIWQIEFAPKFMPPPPPAGAAAGSPSPGASPEASVAPGASPETTAAVSAAPAPSAAPEAPKVPEKLVDAAGPAGLYHFTNLGGGIEKTELAGYAAESGSDVDLNEFGTLPIGAISEQPGQGADLPYTVTNEGDNTVVCTLDQPGSGLAITKKFMLAASTKQAHGYLVTLDVTFTNHGAAAIQSPGYYLYAGSAAPIHQRDLSYYTAFDWFTQDGKSNHIIENSFEAGTIPLVGIQTRAERPVYQVDADKIAWAAVSSQYFTTIVAPQGGAVGDGVWAHHFQVDTATRKVQALEGALKMPAFSVAPGQSVTQSFTIYGGPKIYQALKDLGSGQEHILNFGWLTIVAVFLLNTMNLLHSWTGNYAISIILLTLLVRGALWPIQNRATASMRQMQQLTPRMNELKEKYKDDPNRMNAEVMKLYKEYNINPLAGCLPMFIQMPIFWGFYKVLGTAIELRGSRFLWVHDLSQPDTLFHIGGFPVNILPLFMAVTMLLQMQLQPKSGDAAQQRMFLFMPLIFVLMCYNFASALALYWTVQNVFTIAQLYVTRKRTAPVPLKPIQVKPRRKLR